MFRQCILDLQILELILLFWSNAFKYVSSLNTITLIFPGKSLTPSLFATSPSLLYFSFNNESNWLYSTLFVILVPSFLTNLQIAPIASFGLRGTQMELISNPNLTLEPIAEGMQLKDKIFVSWNKTKYFLPSSIHFLTFPLWYNK